MENIFETVHLSQTCRPSAPNCTIKWTSSQSVFKVIDNNSNLLFCRTPFDACFYLMYFKCRSHILQARNSVCIIISPYDNDYILKWLNFFVSHLQKNLLLDSAFNKIIIVWQMTLSNMILNKLSLDKYVIFTAY